MCARIWVKKIPEITFYLHIHFYDNNENESHGMTSFIHNSPSVYHLSFLHLHTKISTSTSIRQHNVTAPKKLETLIKYTNYMMYYLFAHILHWILRMLCVWTNAHAHSNTHIHIDTAPSTYINFLILFCLVPLVSIKS